MKTGRSSKGRIGGDGGGKQPKPSRKKIKLGQMRKFSEGFDIVHVWSKDEAEHRIALATYALRGYILESPVPTIVKGSDAPIRSTVKRKLKDIE